MFLESRNNRSRIPLWYANNNDHSSIQVFCTRKGMFYIHDLRWCQSDLGCMCSTTTGPIHLPPCLKRMMSSSSVPKGADTCQAGCRPTVVRDLDKGSIGAAYIRFMQKLTMHRNRQCDSSNLDSNRSQNSTRLDTSSVASAAVLVVVSEIGMVSCSDAAKANVLASESAVSLQTLYWPNLQLHSRREHR